jgi:hypothetical protein
LVVNLLGNIPILMVPTLYYRITFTTALLIWVPLVVCVLLVRFKEFGAHMLPEGAPVSLIIILPLIEGLIHKHNY